MSWWRRVKGKAGADADAHAGPADERPGEARGERYARADTAVYFVGDNSHLVYFVADREARLLPSHLAALQQSCRRFKTLDEHAAACARGFGLSPDGAEAAYVESVRDQLDELVGAGLLVAESELLSLCERAAAGREPPPPIATIGVPTYARPDSLERCVKSYAENNRAHGRANDFAVADDSPDAADREAARAKLRALARSYGVEIFYAGPDEKRDFARALVDEEGLPAEVVEFALFNPERLGHMNGANRNALFLHTAGDMFYSSDDDAVCRLAVAPEEEDEFDDDEDSPEPLEFWPYPDQETAVSSARFVEQDLLAAHEQLLGRGVARCVAEYGSADLLNLERLDFRFFRALQTGAGRVLVTLNGMLGDSGTGEPAIFKVLGPGSRARLAEAGGNYFSAPASRNLLRVVRRPVINRLTWCISTALAYDNRAPLPPFVPGGRSSDGVFADSVRQCCPEGYFGDVPWAVLHDPPEARSHTPEHISLIASSPGITDVLSACLMSLQSAAGLHDPRARMRVMGRHLVEVASLPQADFEEYVRTYVLQIRSTSLAEMEGELARYGSAEGPWVGDVRRYLSLMRESLARPDAVVPADLVAGRGPDEARALCRRVVRRFGELLHAWPDIFDAARRLRGRGRRLASRL